MSSMKVTSFRRQYIWTRTQARHAKKANPLKIFMMINRVILALIAYFHRFFILKKKKMNKHLKFNVKNEYLQIQAYHSPEVRQTEGD